MGTDASTSNTTTSSTLLQDFISDDDLRRELNKISDRTLRRLRLKVPLPAVRLGHTMYFSRPAVAKWLEELAAVRGMRKSPRSTSTRHIDSRRGKRRKAG